MAFTKEEVNSVTVEGTSWSHKVIASGSKVRIVGVAVKDASTKFTEDKEDKLELYSIR